MTHDWWCQCSYCVKKYGKLPYTNPPSYCNEGSPGSTKAPLEPGDMCTVHCNALVDTVEQLRVALNSSMKTIESRINLVEARLHHVKELLVHPTPLVEAEGGKGGGSFYETEDVFDKTLLIRKPGDTIPEPHPSFFHRHECHRGLTYREERLLKEMCRRAEALAEKQGSLPKLGLVVEVPGSLDPLHKSTR